MNNDCLSIYDIERCILTGEIVERQKYKVTAEWKYRINGQVAFYWRIGAMHIIIFTAVN